MELDSFWALHIVRQMPENLKAARQDHERRGRKGLFLCLEPLVSFVHVEMFGNDAGPKFSI